MRINLKASWLGLIMGCAIHLHAEDKQLQLYTYPAYFPPAVLAQFEKETGIHVEVGIIDGDNQVIFSKLKSLPTPTYDLALIANYSLQKFRRAKLIDTLDKSQLTHLDALNPQLMHLINPDETQLNALPFVWGTTGILLNTQYHHADDNQSWQSLWQPRLHHQLLLIHDMRDIFGMALLSMHQSPNTQNPALLKQAYQRLMALRPNIRLFGTDDLINLYVDEDITLGMCWSGEAYLAQQANPALQYIYPQEGFGLWADTIALVHDAPHPKAAYAFMNFISRPDVAKHIFMTEGVTVANQGMMPLLPKNIRDNPIINPPASVMKRAKLYRSISASEQQYRDLWHQFRWSLALPQPPHTSYEKPIRN